MKAARDSLLDLDSQTDEELAHRTGQAIVNDLSEIQK
jgi:hypothetical protein